MFQRNILNSGDWVTLDEAALLSNQELGGPAKNGDDILKAGYLDYLGMTRRLKIWTFARQSITIVPVDLGAGSDPLDRSDDEGFPRKLPNSALFSAALTDEEKLAATVYARAGECFELHSGILENLLLLRNLSTADFAESGLFIAVIRAWWIKELPGWEPIKDEAGHRLGYSGEFEGRVDPPIELRMVDLRVDRQELLSYFSEANAVRNENPEAIDRGMAVINRSTDDRSVAAVSFNKHSDFIGALLKALNIGDIRSPAIPVSQLQGMCKDAGVDVSESWIEKRLKTIRDRDALWQTIKAGPSKKTEN